MGSFPGSPRTLGGAILAVDPSNPLARIVIFQYNPDSVTRTLRPREAPAQTAIGAADAHRIWGAPVETIGMTVEIDAADQLASGDPLAATTGIAGQLAVLEMLLYPSSLTVIAQRHGYVCYADPGPVPGVSPSTGDRRWGGRAATRAFGRPGPGVQRDPGSGSARTRSGRYSWRARSRTHHR